MDLHPHPGVAQSIERLLAACNTAQAEARRAVHSVSERPPLWPNQKDNCSKAEGEKASFEHLSSEILRRVYDNVSNNAIFNYVEPL